MIGYHVLNHPASSPSSTTAATVAAAKTTFSTDIAVIAAAIATLAAFTTPVPTEAFTSLALSPSSISPAPSQTIATTASLYSVAFY